MKTTIRNYRGYIITSFDMAQLKDPDVRGRSYSVYSKQGFESGEMSLSARESLCSLFEAKCFVDDLVKKEVAS
jgi:hypothetical protein